MREKIFSFLKEIIFMRHLESKSQPFNASTFITCTCIIGILSFLSIFWMPLLIIALGFIVFQYYLLNFNHVFYIKKITSEKEKYHSLEEELHSLDLDSLQEEITQLNNRKTSISKSIDEKSAELSKLQNEYSDLAQTIKRKEAAAESEIQLEITKKQEQVKKEAKKVSKFREMYKSIKYSIDNFFLYDPSPELLKFSPEDMEEVDALVPSVMLHLQYMNSKELRKAYRDNNKQIEKLMEQYSSRYTTKANKAIYALMVIALRAELQNVLSELKYDKLDNSISSIKHITMKYLQIAGDGNQNIAGTLTKFISQLEYLFINAAKIEYNYYIKKEKEKQEQLAIKEKMREEASERRALEAEKKKIEQEEAKYHSEIEKMKEQLLGATQNEMEALQKRILELQSQLSDVIIKKEDIISLQNGKAGTVYIISNLGSFGDDVFKIGMTRRLDPQDRVNELGSASVPFKFDVHSFIFSEDAVTLEHKIHEMLNDRRVNKVNARKEFFKISLDDLEKLVEEIEPTADFNRTMLANEYRASLNSENYTEDFVLDDVEQ